MMSVTKLTLSPPDQMTPCTGVAGGVSGRHRECRSTGLMTALYKPQTATETVLT